VEESGLPGENHRPAANFITQCFIGVHHPMNLYIKVSLKGVSNVNRLLRSGNWWLVVKQKYTES
jgi:hypothetical protein